MHTIVVARVCAGAARFLVRNKTYLACKCLMRVITEPCRGPSIHRSFSNMHTLRAMGNKHPSQNRKHHHNTDCA